MSFNATLLVGAGLACLVVWGLTPLVRMWALRVGMIDYPDFHRKKHKGPIPLIGGLVLCIGLLAGISWYVLAGQIWDVSLALPEWPVWGGLIGVVALGFWDDWKHVHFRVKLLVQICIASFIVASGYHFDLTWFEFGEGGSWANSSIEALVTILWIVGIVNAVNLIDGLDGLAGGVVLIGLIGLSIASVLAGETSILPLVAVVCGGLVAFLYYNTGPASIFLGDHGSLLLGYVLAMSALLGEAAFSAPYTLIIPIFASSYPIWDTCISIFRRGIRRSSPFHADHDHVHHRLLAKFGGCHRPVAFLIYGLSILGAATAVMLVAYPVVGWALAGAGVILTFGVMRWLGYVHVRETLAQIRQSYSIALPVFKSNEKLEHGKNPQEKDVLGGFQARPKNLNALYHDVEESGTEGGEGHAVASVQ